MKRPRPITNAGTRPAPAGTDKTVGLRLADYITLVRGAKPVKPAKKSRV